MAAEREWQPDYRLDLYGVLAPLRRGRGDPAFRTEGPGGAIWRTSTTPDGAVTTRLHRRGDGTVVATAWGDGAGWSLANLPELLGCADRPEEFVAHHPLVAESLARMPGLRFGASR